MEGRVGFVSGLEVKYITKTPPEGYTASKYFAAVEPADEYGFKRFGNIKEFAVHLFNVQFKVLRKTLCNGMTGKGLLGFFRSMSALSEKKRMWKNKE